MDIVHAKGASFYQSGAVTLMQAYTVTDVVGTQQRYQAAVADAADKYNSGEITLAQHDELVAQAEFERLYVPLTTRVQSQKTLDKVRVKPAGEKEDQGFLTDINYFDCEVGIDNNNFELKMDKVKSMTVGIELGDYVYREGTEFGGIIDGRTIDTSTDEIIWSGTAWRGLLENDIVRPKNPATDAFRVVSGDANSILRTILAENGGTGSFFSVPSAAAGVTLSNYQFPRYINKLKALKDMLASVNYRLKIWADNKEVGGTFSVWCCAVPIQNFSQEIEYSQDTNRIDIKMTQDYSVCNHLICLGAGELTARTVIDLYVDRDGNITNKKPSKGFFGVYERTAIYDYSSVDGETDAEKKANLQKAGIIRLQELNEVSSMELTVDDIAVDVGDIVAGLDRTTGMEMQKAITNKILRIDAAGKETIELSVNGKEVEQVDIS